MGAFLRTGFMMKPVATVLQASLIVLAVAFIFTTDVAADSDDGLLLEDLATEETIPNGGVADLLLTEQQGVPQFSCERQCSPIKRGSGFCCGCMNGPAGWLEDYRRAADTTGRKTELLRIHNQKQALKCLVAKYYWCVAKPCPGFPGGGPPQGDEGYAGDQDDGPIMGHGWGNLAEIAVPPSNTSLADEAAPKHDDLEALTRILDLQD